MPFTECGDLRVHYELSGQADAPVVMLSNSLGTTLSLWDPQMPALEEKFRVLRYDTRGHGETTVPPPPYTVERLARDAVALLDALGLERVHFCGLSLGGMIGMWLGIHARERLNRLALCNTAPKIGTVEGWNARIEHLRNAGVKEIVPAVIERWFTPEFRRRAPERVAWTQRMIETVSLEGYVGCCTAIRDMDLREEIAGISAPTLVIAGSEDPATPPADVRFLADRIPGARYAELPAAHLSNLEAAEKFTAELTRFLNG
jgi:3-oxoadipate enol-lactonase